MRGTSKSTPAYRTGPPTEDEIERDIAAGLRSRSYYPPMSEKEMNKAGAKLVQTFVAPTVIAPSVHGNAAPFLRLCVSLAESASQCEKAATRAIDTRETLQTISMRETSALAASELYVAAECKLAPVYYMMNLRQQHRNVPPPRNTAQRVVAGLGPTVSASAHDLAESLEQLTGLGVYGGVAVPTRKALLFVLDHIDTAGYAAFAIARITDASFPAPTPRASDLGGEKLELFGSAYFKRSDGSETREQAPWNYVNVTFVAAVYVDARMYDYKGALDKEE